MRWVLNAFQRGDIIMGDLPFNMSKLMSLCRQHNIRRLGIFGSFARGEAQDDSDIDLLVHFSERISLLEMVALERQFSEVLGRRVDLLTEAAISLYLRERIQQDVRVIYEA
jgi:hypothetical protein